MGNFANPRYGIPAKEIDNLSKRYYSIDGRHNWECIDAFFRWCSENGYKKGISLRRHDSAMPHSPENSFFGNPTKEEIQNRKRKKRETMDIKSPFCDGCKKVCPGSGSGGCDEWQEYFKKNWDRNISIAPPKPEPVVESNAPMVFRYEHPDLVREGIVFANSQSVP